MAKKKKPEVETEMRALLPEQIEECAQKLAGLIRSKKTIKRQAKEAAHRFKQQLEEIEQEEERLSQAILTQQEEIPVKRQMTLAEIEDQRRHEKSLAEFERETNAFGLGKQDEPASAITAESSDTPDGEAQKCQECGAVLPYTCATELCDDCLNKAIAAPAGEAAQPGRCRVCDCTDAKPCIDGATDACCWMDQEETFCSSCAQLMEEHGLDEATLRARLQNNTRDDSPAVHGSARDLADFKASLGGRTDSELFKLQIQFGKHEADRPYFEATLDERLRREDSPAEASPEVASTQAPPDRNTVEGGLYAALHRVEKAGERWQKLREKGATDKALKDAVCRELGISGGSSGPGMKPIAYRGGKEPAFWFDRQPPSKPTLKGKALVDKAREVLAIPDPVYTQVASNGSKKTRLTIHDLAEQMEHMGPVTRGDLSILGYRDSTIESAVIHKLIKLSEKGIARHRDTYVLVNQTDPLDLVPGDFHHRTWSSLSDVELAQWRDRLSKYQKLTGLAPDLQAENATMLERVNTVIASRDAAWSKSESAGGAK